MSESWRFGCREWGGVTDDLEFALLARLREVVDGTPVSEVELRKLSEQGDAWARTLEAQLRASEERVEQLNADGESSLSAIADELRRIERLRPELNELRTQLVGLNARARELRTAWLLSQAMSEAAGPDRT
jgi:chromosome segregation ATPase